MNRKGFFYIGGISGLLFLLLLGASSGPHLHSINSGPDYTGLLKALTGLVSALTLLIGALKGKPDSQSKNQPVSEDKRPYYEEVSDDYGGSDFIWVKVFNGYDRRNRARYRWIKCIPQPQRRDDARNS